MSLRLRELTEEERRTRGDHYSLTSWALLRPARVVFEG